MKLLVPTVIPINIPPQPDVDIVFYDVAKEIPVEHHDARGAVFWLNPAEQVAGMAKALTKLEWAQGLMAGVDVLLAAGFSPDVKICAGVGLHDEPVAEHVVGLILAAARRLDIAVTAQNERRWPEELAGNQTMDRTGFTTLAGAKVLIWGYGGIGEALAKKLQVFGAEVIGVKRTPEPGALVQTVQPTEVADILPTIDVLVSLLPGTRAAQNTINAEVLGGLPQHAWFISAGRGSAVDEDALVTALREGAIGGAALDVFAVEPLPNSSDLWDAPNLIMTPHSAGGRPRDPEKLIVENLRRLRNGEPLKGLVSES